MEPQLHNPELLRRLFRDIKNYREVYSEISTLSSSNNKAKILG